jgi:hypothetical protein
MMLFATRPNEARGLHLLALRTALEHDLVRQAVNANGNLSDLEMQRDRYRDCLRFLEDGLALARRIGDRRNEWFLVCEQSYVLTMLGRWDEALARAAELPDDRIGADTGFASLLTGVLEVRLRRGQLVAAQELLARFEELGRSEDVQTHGAFHGGTAAVRLAEGRAQEALAAAERAIAGRATLGLGSQDVKQGYRHGLEAVFQLGDDRALERLLRIVEEAPPGLRPPYLVALVQRFRARTAGDEPEADRLFAAATAQFAALELPYETALTSLEHAEWLRRAGRPEAEPLRMGAVETLEQLGATPALEQLGTVDAVPA